MAGLLIARAILSLIQTFSISKCEYSVLWAGRLRLAEIVERMSNGERGSGSTDFKE